MQGIASRAIRYFYDPESMNDNPACPPIWCLGREYDSRASDDIEGRVGDAAEQYDIGPRPWPRKFLDDFEARIWMTYRSGFPCIQRSTSTAKSGTDLQAGVADTLRSFLGDVLGDKDGFRTDTGWGCMIRSAQCVLANALVLLQLGRDWRRGEQEDLERSIIQRFADDPLAPLSIHRYVSIGDIFCGKAPGEWFGPSAAARCIS